VGGNGILYLHRVKEWWGTRSPCTPPYCAHAETMCLKKKLRPVLSIVRTLVWSWNLVQ